MKFIISFILLILIISIITLSNVSEPSANNSNNTSQHVEMNPLEIPLITIIGDTIKLSDFNFKTLLIVNVASKCGYTSQYEDLERLYQTYKDSGLVIMGFPANNFGNQEPGSNEEILKFCRSNFNVTFPMMSKISVKGKDKHPLFIYLTENSEIPGEIKWNFTKFLLNHKGHLVNRFNSQVSPFSKEIVDKIREHL